MKSPEYWSKRFEILNESMLNRGEEYEATTRREYAKAQAAIRKEVNAFYQRFAKNNGGMTLADARQTLRKGELAEFKWSVEDYIKAGRENAIDQRWMKELENASIRVRVSRLEALQLQMRQHIEVLFGKQQAGASRLLRGIYKDGYYRSIFELQKGLGLGSSFAKLDKTQIEKLLSTPWAPDGSNFSARIWRDRTKLVGELQTTLTQGLIRGTSADQLIGEFALRMNVSISDAKRIILTESAYFANQASLDGFKELGVENFRYVATLDSRTSFKCREMDGKVFKLEEAQPGVNVPPLHAHCRSVTIPYFEDNVRERAGEGPNGERKMFPGDMTYNEWASEQAPEALRPAPVTEPTKAVDPPEVKTVDPSTPVSAPLTQKEEAAVLRYIGGESYVLNDKLRRAMPLNETEMEWMEDLDRALFKAPRYVGDVSRSVGFPSPDSLKDFLQDIQIGAVLQYPQYISTTHGADPHNPNAQVQFYILDAQFGRDITFYNPGELEVLYERDFPFKVMAVEEINGVFHVLLQEMTK